MKILYEKTPLFDEGFLKVSDIHSIYYAPEAAAFRLQASILIPNFTE